MHFLLAYLNFIYFYGCEKQLGNTFLSLSFREGVKKNLIVADTEMFFYTFSVCISKDPEWYNFSASEHSASFSPKKTLFRLRTGGWPPPPFTDMSATIRCPFLTPSLKKYLYFIITLKRLQCLGYPLFLFGTLIFIKIILFWVFYWKTSKPKDLSSLKANQIKYNEFKFLFHSISEDIRLMYNDILHTLPEAGSSP